jgi:hypothetical protein
MAIYLIPIFCFGLVIIGIVCIGIQQASDLARQLSDVPNEAPRPSDNKL